MSTEPILANYFVKTPFQKKDYVFYQSTSSLCACAAAFLAIYDPQQFIHIGNVAVLLHCLWDSFFAKWDMLLHHVCIISFTGFLYANNGFCDDSVNILTNMFRMEYSTVFLSGSTLLREYTDNPYMRRILEKVDPILNIGFVVAFFKYRILDYGANVIFNPSAYRWHITTMNYGPLPIAHYDITLFVFYGLNLYWAVLIVKGLYKKFVQKGVGAISRLDSYFVCERLEKYSAGIALFSAGYVYWRDLRFFSFKSPAPPFGRAEMNQTSAADCAFSMQNGAKDYSVMFTAAPWIDCAGLAVLTLTSYRYHSYLYDRLNREGEENYDKLTADILWVFNDDICAITLHSFCSFLALTWHIQSLRFAVSAFAMCVICAVISKCNSALFRRLVEKGGDRHSFHSVLINSSCIFGFAIAFYNMTIDSAYEDIMTFSATHMTFFYLHAATVYLRPLNKLNHFVFHLVLAGHHYFIAREVVHY